MKAIKVTIFLVVACIWLVANAQQAVEPAAGQQQGGAATGGAATGGEQMGGGEALKLSGIWISDDNKFSFALRHVGNLVYGYGSHLPAAQQGGAAAGGAQSNTTAEQGGAATQQAGGAAAAQTNATQGQQQQQQPTSSFVILFNGVVAPMSQAATALDQQQQGNQTGAAPAANATSTTTTTTPSATVQAPEPEGGAPAAGGAAQPQQQGLGLISGTYTVIPVDRTALEAMDQGANANRGWGVVAVQINDNNTLSIIQSNLPNMTVAKLTRYQGEQSGAASGQPATNTTTTPTGQ